MPQSDSPVTLLCLCASRINNVDRLHRLGQLLASVSAQENKNFKLFLGISFERAEFREVVERQLRENDKNTIHVFLFSKGQTQFERYSAILKALRNKRYITPDRESNTYLSFTDDDDLWAPQRMSVFRQGAEKLHADKRNPKYVFTIKHFKADVEKNTFARWDQLPIDESKFYEYSYPREYLDIVCKFSLFEQFITVASPDLLAHPLCDLVLTKWVVTTASIKDDQQREIFLRMNCSRPVYYYRRNPPDADYSFYIHSGTSWTSNEIQENGMLTLLNAQLIHPSIQLLSDDDLVHTVMIDDTVQHVPIPKEYWFYYLRLLRALPLWRHIFVDLLGHAES